MPGLTAKFVSAIFLNILAGLLLATVARGEPATAEGCLSAPWGDAPAGSHWRYHIDHTNKRNCWYLRNDSGATSQAVPQNSAAAQQHVAPAPSQPAKSSISDARAELRPQPAREDNAATSAPANVTGNPAANTTINDANSASASVWNGTATVATRWPDVPAPSSVPAAAPATATAINDASQPPTDPAQAILPSIPFTHFTVPVQPQTIFALIAAALGALAFAGAAALISMRYRRGRVRRRSATSARGPIWETTDDDRIVLSDYPATDDRDYRPRFARGVASATSRSRAPKSEFVQRAPRRARGR